MAKIYKRSDRIPVKIDDVTLVLAPLSTDQKAEITSCMIKGRRGDMKEATRGVVLSVKYAVKDVRGVEDAEGTPYALEFDDDKNLSEDCLSDLFNLHISNKMAMVCAALARSIPSEFTDENGNKIEGVEIVKREDDSKNV